MESASNNITIRPFTRVYKLLLSALNPSGVVELRDSVGAGIKCNYIEVMGTEPATGTGYFQVFLSGVGETAPVSGVDSTRGSIGMTCMAGGVATFNLDYGDECSAIAIVNKFGTATDFAINYGVVKSQRSKYLLEVKPNLGSK